MVSYINCDELEHSRFMTELFWVTLAEHREYNNNAFISSVYDSFVTSV